MFEVEKGFLEGPVVEPHEVCAYKHPYEKGERGEEREKKINDVVFERERKIGRNR